MKPERLRLLGGGLTALLLVVAALQVSLALGAPLASFAWGGSGGTNVLPDRLRVGSAVAALVLGGFVFVVLDRARILARPRWPRFFRVAGWALVVQLALSTLGNLASPSMPERVVMGPLSLVMLVLALSLALGR